MSHVATLIANPEEPAVGAKALASAAEVLAHPEPAVELATGVAADIPFGGGEEAESVEARLREALAGLPIDVLVQRREGRRKALLLADMDSTIIGQECIDELADFVGAKAHVAMITDRAMRGEIAFEPALRERVAILAGLPVTVIEEVIRDRITLTPGATALVRTMKAYQARTVLVSGGFSLFTERVARHVGFDENHGNRLEVKDGVLTGRVIEPILGRAAKKDALIAARDRVNLSPSQTIAVGDGANDLAMLEEAGLGVAYHAKPAVAAAARMRVDHGDLTALLYAQGYAVTDFVD
jgi:phosphoserine phosphatase